MFWASKKFLAVVKLLVLVSLLHVVINLVQSSFLRHREAHQLQIRRGNGFLGYRLGEEFDFDDDDFDPTGAKKAQEQNETTEREGHRAGRGEGYSDDYKEIKVHEYYPQTSEEKDDDDDDGYEDKYDENDNNDGDYSGDKDGGRDNDENDDSENDNGDFVDRNDMDNNGDYDVDTSADNENYDSGDIDNSGDYNDDTYADNDGEKGDNNDYDVEKGKSTIYEKSEKLEEEKKIEKEKGKDEDKEKKEAKKEKAEEKKKEKEEENDMAKEEEKSKDKEKKEEKKEEKDEEREDKEEETGKEAEGEKGKKEKKKGKEEEEEVKKKMEKEKEEKQKMEREMEEKQVKREMEENQKVEKEKEEKLKMEKEMEEKQNVEKEKEKIAKKEKEKDEAEKQKVKQEKEKKKNEEENEKEEKKAEEKDGKGPKTDEGGTNKREEGQDPSRGRIDGRKRDEAYPVQAEGKGAGGAGGRKEQGQTDKEEEHQPGMLEHKEQGQTDQEDQQHEEQQRNGTQEEGNERKDTLTDRMNDFDFYDGVFKVNETYKGASVVKVLLLAYQRSGSSFTGELLTSGNESMYVYEPLFPWRNRLAQSDHMDAMEGMVRALGDLFDCRDEVLRQFENKGFRYFRRTAAGSDWCDAAPLRLIKTIRFRSFFGASWLRRRPDIKVIHLVRDPRGIISSVKKGGGIWGKHNRDAELQCLNMKDDLQLETLLGPQRYLRIRYEDLVDNTTRVTKDALEFAGVGLTEEVKGYIEKHTEGDSRGKGSNYMGTYRDQSFLHDRWKTILTRNEIEDIQTTCSDVMEKLDYKPYRSES
ncbi:uncharacterized protein LOC143020050 [Oratosquilla oratoria]|uniref:uncharacterized protein LOC143020050 n=1 Tax=Oratosquilla oratoria TaxID=337810 RepID=UPI003F7676B9